MVTLECRDIQCNRTGGHGELIKPYNELDHLAQALLDATALCSNIRNHLETEVSGKKNRRDVNLPLGPPHRLHREGVLREAP
jgi:hypothetical protein